MGIRFQAWESPGPDVGLAQSKMTEVAAAGVD